MSKVVCKVLCWNFFLVDALWLGRAVKVDSDQIATLIENNHYYTTHEIANILKISKSTNLLVKMKKCLLLYGKKHLHFLANPVIFIS